MAYPVHAPSLSLPLSTGPVCALHNDRLQAFDLHAAGSQEWRLTVSYVEGHECDPCPGTPGLLRDGAEKPFPALPDWENKTKKKLIQ